MRFNFFNSQGALEDGQEFADARQGALIEAQEYADANPYFAATTPKEQLHFSRTMIPVTGANGVQLTNGLGQPLYETPERQIYLKNAQYIQGLEDKAKSDFERKVNNPLFKVGDFAADLFRNTIAAPINLITGDQGFHVDPSERAVTGYQNRLLELDKLRTANHQRFIGGRDTRASAFANAVTKTVGSPVSTADGKLAVTTYNDQTGEIGSQYVPLPDGSGFLDPAQYQMTDMGGGVQGVVNLKNPAGGVNNVITAESVAENQRAVESGKKQGQIEGEAVATARINYKSLEEAVNNQRALIKKLINHEGLSKVVGTALTGYPARYVGGSDEATFVGLFNELSGKNFLAMRQELKGGGSITDFEGQRAEQALAGLDFKMNKETFIEQLLGLDAILQRSLVAASDVANGRFTTANGNTYRVIEDE